MTARRISTASLTALLAGGSVCRSGRGRRSSALRCGGRCGGRCRCCCGHRLRRRVEPTGMDPGVESLRRLRVDAALADDAAERCLDMAARTAKTVVEIEMAEGGIHVVPPQQANHPPPEPHAFGIAGGSGELFCRFGEFLDLALRLFGSIGRLRRGLVIALGIAALGYRML